MRLWTSLAVLLCVAMSVSAESALDGRVITFDAGSWMSLYPPLALPYEGAPPEGRIRAVEESTGKDFPATIRNGQFVFTPEGAMPNTRHAYRIYVEPIDLPPVVRIEKAEAGGALNVFVEDKPVASYASGAELPRPILNLLTEIGGSRVADTLWTGYGLVNGAACWSDGQQKSGETTFGSGGAYGWIRTTKVWQNAQQTPLLDETSEYRFYAWGYEGCLFDVFIELSATYGEVQFTPVSEQGLMNIRVADSLKDRREGGLPAADAPQETGGWCDVSGAFGETKAGVTLFALPANPGHPPVWGGAASAMIAADCFGQKGGYTLKKGESLQLGFRIFVHGEATADELKGRYADFATPPKAIWAPEPETGG